MGKLSKEEAARYGGAAWMVEYIKKNGIEAAEQEPCEDCVSREEAIKWMENIRSLNQYYHPEDNDDETLVSEVIGRLNKLPSVTPQPKMGRWKYVQYDGNPNIGNLHCSECDRIAGFEYEYCPNCGARMVSE